MDRKLGRLRAYEKLMSYLHPQIQRAPVAIDTLYDYMWWMNFSMKWQVVSLRLLAHIAPQPQMRLGETLIHFFQHRAFQQWALRARTQKIKETWPTYKYPAKAYIYAFHEDQEYLEKKEKEQSLKDAIVQSRSFFRLPKTRLWHRWKEQEGGAIRANHARPSAGSRPGAHRHRISLGQPFDAL